MDWQAVAIGAAVGGSTGTIAALVLWALVGRFIYRTWLDLDALRSKALDELRLQNADLRRRLELLEDGSSAK